MNIVYHARYLDYWEWARTEMLRDKLIAYHDIEQKNFYLPCINVNIDYHAPANYDDVLTTEINFSIKNNLKLHFSYLTKKNRILVASGESTHIFTNQDKKAVRIPKFFSELLDGK